MIKAKYTVVLKNLLDDANVRELIDNALSTYPIYLKTSQEINLPSFVPTRAELNEKLLNYYKYREIGFDSVGRFIDELKIAINEIMPYYNQMFATVDQDFRMIYNVDYLREHTLTREGTEESETSATTNGNSENSVTDSTTSTSTMGNDNKTVNSKTPQSQISITSSNIDDVSYADDVNWQKGNNTENGTSNGSSSSTTANEIIGTGTGSNEKNESENFQEHISGNYGQVSYQSLIRQYRENIVNIEQEIINNPRISELFMLIY